MSDGRALSRPASPLAHMRDRMAEADAAFRAGLDTAATEADILRLARNLLGLCDEVAETLRHLVPVKALACRAGCDTCCHSLIQVNPVFAILAMAEARRIFSADQFEILRNRLVSGSSFCPFLFDGACAIYQSRPMVCRGYYSFDLALCRQGDYCEKDLGYQGDGAHAAHQLMIFLFALEKRLESIEESLGLDSGPVFLHAAARVLLEGPDAARRWRTGERVFPGALLDAAGDNP
ncbi:YkgJ family cysteine cluster protein [Nguyenibacter vanlangensis]|uniref:YkgJ family cysteine cluster protein n=1 Tax=Nguyenibacter vanlangensis TaxID=1216886 RepID=A0ABZ3D3C3_9PROT